MNYTIINNYPKEDYHKLLELIQISFKEHADNGLQFSCLSYTLDVLISKIADGCVFVAIDDSGMPIGMTSFSVYRDNHNVLCAYVKITCVSPLSKKLGVGTALYNNRKKYLKDVGCSYVISDTAVAAVSSVRWHMEKCGCKIVGYKSFPSTNYYSYVFREDLIPKGWFTNNIVYPVRLIWSYIVCRICFKENGSMTKTGRLALAIKKFLLRQ